MSSTAREPGNVLLHVLVWCLNCAGPAKYSIPLYGIMLFLPLLLNMVLQDQSSLAVGVYARLQSPVLCLGTGHQEILDHVEAFHIECQG